MNVTAEERESIAAALASTGALIGAIPGPAGGIAAAALGLASLLTRTLGAEGALAAIHRMRTQDPAAWDSDEAAQIAGRPA